MHQNMPGWQTGIKNSGVGNGMTDFSEVILLGHGRRKDKD
jgi:hypothetical protein